MEILRRGLIIFFITIALCAYSQNNEKEINAFSESHAMEYDGNYTEAIDVLKEVYIEDSYEINIRIGWLYYISGMFTESIPYYQKSIKLKPLSIEARLGIINPIAAMGNWTQVENIYLDVLEIDPENSTSLYRLGSIYYGQEDYKKASKYFERLLNHYPFDYDSMIMSAWTNLRIGETRKAKVLFSKVLMNTPNDKSALEGLSLIE